MKILSLYILFSYTCLNAVIAQELTAEKIYTKINDAVVTIYTFDGNGKILSQGSGVVLNEQGWVVTNYHVYAGSEKLIVKHKEKIIEYSTIIGLDVEKDILILKIVDHAFPAITIGNSDLLKVGQKIYAIGSPMGFENSITEGIISGLRSFEQKTKNFIQVSAAISPGSSGGAVLNTKGELIAITTSTITKGQNLNFAIPINEVLDIYKKVGVNSKELSSAIYFYKGNTAYDSKNYDAAIDNYKKAIAINPEFAEAFNNLGNVYSDKGEKQIAIATYTKAITIDSEYDAAYNNLASAYSDIGQTESAIVYFKKAIFFNPKYAEAYYNLANLYSNKGDIGAAITYYEKAITINPEFAEAFNNLGNEYSDKGENQIAITYYTKAIAINSEYAVAYNNLGSAYSELGDTETAIANFKKAINIDPEYANAYYNLGVMYSRKGDINMKNYYLEKAFQINPRLRNK